MSEFKKYAEFVESLKVYPYTSTIIYPALGLCGEAGEVAEKIKKIIRDKGGVYTPEDKTEIVKELGDVLFYITALSQDLGFSLEDVAGMNVEKLMSRKERNVLHGNGDNR
jgi:NTP pyrophosphatase (non-canonical NTP hydrolase)